MLPYYMGVLARIGMREMSIDKDLRATGKIRRLGYPQDSTEHYWLERMSVLYGQGST